jgi:hypothetical protein
MKYRAMLATGVSWEDAMAFAKERAGKLAAKAAVEGAR